jgi:hypothetical protein
MEIVEKMQFARNAFLYQGRQYVVRDFNYRDASIVCSWITNQEMLSMVSGDTSDGLNTKILEKWITTAIKAIVVYDLETDTVVGFCTITIKELPTIRHKYVELCHLIINPEYCMARYDIGLLLTSQAKEWALIYGFDCIIGRCVPSNNYANQLAKKVYWNIYEDDSAPKDFNWYKHKINK